MKLTGEQSTYLISFNLFSSPVKRLLDFALPKTQILCLPLQITIELLDIRVLC